MSFNEKKFAALIAFDDNLRNEFFDRLDVAGINSTWDVYHVLADEEVIPQKEVEIMKEIYDQYIDIDADLRKKFENSIIDFKKNLQNKIQRNISK